MGVAMPRRPGSKLPNRNEWHLSNALTGSNPPFAVLTMNFDAGTDDVRHLHFKDPWPDLSGNQAGHFTTALDMGFFPR